MLVYLDRVRQSGDSDPHELLGLPFGSDDPDTRFILFSDALIGDMVAQPATIDDTVCQVVWKRYFIDLGFGVPEDHVDLILVTDRKSS